MNVHNKEKETVENGVKSRFHKASDKEIESLQLDAKAACTHQQTKWGIKILKGKAKTFAVSFQLYNCPAYPLQLNFHSPPDGTAYIVSAKSSACHP